MPRPKTSFRPQLEEMEGRLVPATLVPTLGQSPVFVNLITTASITQLDVTVPNGNTLTLNNAPPPTTPIEQLVLAYEQSHATPPSPINPGSMVAAGFITPAP